MDNLHLDEVVSLAFSLQSTPGSYALVLGAGVSVPSGVPSAWGVQEQLLRKLAQVEHEEPADPFDWYERRFGRRPTYESLLERLGPTQHERQSIVRGFFEATEEEAENGLKSPTMAHKSIARLVASGAVRLIITLNFDRLVETALRDVGVEPVVVSHPSEVQGLAPLHTLPATVIHLHGDYLNPTGMLNTKAELEVYSPEVQELLSRIIYDHGLVFVGWSASYDPALLHAVSSSPRRIYTPYWVEPGVFSEVAEDLRVRIQAVHLATDADTALGQLADAVDSLRQTKSRHPLALPVAVNTAKRSLSGRTTAIGLHDQIKQEIDSLHNQEDLRSSPSGDPSADGGYVGMASRVAEATTVLSGLIAATAYWGDDSTDRWWIEEVSRLATKNRGNGQTSVLELPLLSSTQLFYAAGIAATAAERYDLARALMHLMTEDQDRGSSPLCTVLLSEGAYPGQASSKWLYTHLKPLFVEHLTIGSAKYDDSWELFEFLRMVEATYMQPGASQLVAHLTQRKQELGEADRELEAARGTNDLDRLEAAEVRQRQAIENCNRVLGSLADQVRVWNPYVQVEDAVLSNSHGFRSSRGLKLIQQLEWQQDRHPYVQAGFCDSDLSSLTSVSEAVGLAIGQKGRDVLQQSFEGGIVPSRFHIGDL